MPRLRSPLVAVLAAAFVLAPSARAKVAPLQVEAGSYPFGRDRAALSGQQWNVRGTVSPYVEGRKVIVRFYRGRELVKVARADVEAGKGGSGRFSVRYRTGRPGLWRVEAVMPSGGGAAAARAPDERVFVLSPRARSGPAMRFFQQRLARMGYWPSVTGRSDFRSRWAIMAYRKVNRLSRNFGLTRGIFERVARGSGRFKPRYGATGRNRVEAVISRQVIALIDGKGRVVRVFPTSTGKPSTPSDRGRFRFYMKQPGVNGVGMVNSTYYNGGEAIHGYPSVPTYNASGGCLRIPTTYSRTVMNWIRLGDRIDVY